MKKKLFLSLLFTMSLMSAVAQTEIREHVVMDHGNRAVRADADATISRPDLLRDKQKCFILMSKKDYYLYVYEAQGRDTVMLARYDCAFGLRVGNKQMRGDKKTPSCTMRNPFSISQIANASTWRHDFGDGRGNILAYGAWFLRLVTPGHSGIGIHGSTNNRESVPGRASEGCIRLKDEDIKDLKQNYAFVGMKVVIKSEKEGDLPFEKKAIERQGIKRLRNFDARITLTNEKIEAAKLEKFAPKLETSETAAMEAEVEELTKDLSAMPAAAERRRTSPNVFPAE